MVSAIVVLTLALSIGIATATYGVVHRLDATLYQLLAARSRTLEEFSAYDWGRAAIGTGAAPDTMIVAAVTPSFFPMLRVHPSLGRGFANADARPDAPLIAILGDSMWRAQFGGSPSTIGRTITVNGKVHVARTSERTVRMRFSRFERQVNKDGCGTAGQRTDTFGLFRVRLIGRWARSQRYSPRVNALAFAIHRSQYQGHHRGIG